MITERTLSCKFPSLWKEILPVLTPNFMRVFNESYIVRLKDKDGSEISSVPIQAESSRMDLVAELAVQSVKFSNERKKGVVDVFTSTENLRKVWRVSQSLIDSYEGRKPSIKFNVTDEERSEAFELSRNFEIFLSQFTGDIQFSPTISGAGVIDTCQGDLSIDRTLFEIKTVNRNFQSKDIKQLLIYLALDTAMTNRRWERAGLFNPRRAVWCRFEVDSFVRQTSRGLTMHDVLAELISAFSRTAEMDTMF